MFYLYFYFIYLIIYLFSFLFFALGHILRQNCYRCSTLRGGALCLHTHTDGGMFWWLTAALQLRDVKSSSRHAHLLALDTSPLRCTCISVSVSTCKLLVLYPLPSPEVLKKKKKNRRTKSKFLAGRRRAGSLQSATEQGFCYLFFLCKSTSTDPAGKRLSSRRATLSDELNTHICTQERTLNRGQTEVRMWKR